MHMFRQKFILMVKNINRSVCYPFGTLCLVSNLSCAISLLIPLTVPGKSVPTYHWSCFWGMGKMLCVFWARRETAVFLALLAYAMIWHELIIGNPSCMTIQKKKKKNQQTNQKTKRRLDSFVSSKLPKTWDLTFLHQLKPGRPSLRQSGPAWLRSGARA